MIEAFIRLHFLQLFLEERLLLFVRHLAVNSLLNYLQQFQRRGKRVKSNLQQSFLVEI
jgi:hypothetical protein